MFIGSLFTIAGYILALLGGGTSHAQKDEQVFDKIVCNELEVVNSEGKVVTRFDGLFGDMTCYNPEGM